MPESQSGLVVIAIFVSQFEARLIAGMLNGYGIHTVIDGDHYASVEFNSLALGGHRLSVIQEDYEVASDILRQGGVLAHEPSYSKPSSTLFKFLGLVFGCNAVVILPGVMLGAAPCTMLFLIPWSVFSVPVDPKGPPDYFLAASAN